MANNITTASISLSLLGTLLTIKPVNANSVQSHLRVSDSGLQTLMCYWHQEQKSCKQTNLKIQIPDSNATKQRSNKSGNELQDGTSQGLSLEIPGNFIFHIEGL